MRYMPTCYFTKPLINLVDSLIEDGNRSYSTLSDADRDHVIARCIEALGDDAYSCIIDSEMMMPNLKKFIISCKKDDAMELANTLHQAAANYFEDDMNQMFQERSAINKYVTNIESGLRPHKDRSTGEIQWRKSA